MAKKAYIGVNGVARKIKKGYVGVDGLARKIKKAYIGIGGVARPCWSGGTLTYYGTLEPLPDQWYDQAATTVGEYALFAGGPYSSNKVIAYNESLTQIAVDNLTVSRKYNPAATTVGNYAVVGGGNSSDGRFDIYDASLTHQISTFESPVKRYYLAATTVGNYGVFAGGGRDASSETDRVDYCDDSLTFSAGRVLKSPRSYLAATTVGEYALFAGGGYYSKVVDVYDASMTQLNRSDYLRTARRELAATTVGEYALFAGGQSASRIYTDIVDAFDVSLTRLDSVTDLYDDCANIPATTIEEFAIFAGGRYLPSDSNAGIGINTVVVYDASLVRKLHFGELSKARGSGAATTLKNFAIIVGGVGRASGAGYDEPNTVDVFTVI